MKKEILPAVAVAIFDENGAVLLQKRRDVDQWAIVSGHVEFGETVEEAVIREIYEETNVKATIKRFIGIYSSPPTQTYHYPGKTVQYITSYFEAQLEKNIEDNFANDETVELKFFLPNNIPADLAIMNPDWLNDALDKNGTVFIR